MSCIAYLGDHMLQYLVEFLHCSISLWMLGSAPLVLNVELLYHCADSVIDEATPLVAHQYLQKTKPSNNIIE